MRQWNRKRWLITIGLVYLSALVFAALFLLLSPLLPCPPDEDLLTVFQRNNVRQEFRIDLVTADLVVIQDRLSEYAGFPVETEDDLVRAVEEYMVKHETRFIARFHNDVIPESFLPNLFTEGIVGPIGAARGLIGEAWRDRVDETESCTYY